MSWRWPKFGLTVNHSHRQTSVHLSNLLMLVHEKYRIIQWPISNYNHQNNCNRSVTVDGNLAFQWSSGYELSFTQWMHYRGGKKYFSTTALTLTGQHFPPKALSYIYLRTPVIKITQETKNTFFQPQTSIFTFQIPWITWGVVLKAEEPDWWNTLAAIRTSTNLPCWSLRDCKHVIYTSLT